MTRIGKISIWSLVALAGAGALSLVVFSPDSTERQPGQNVSDAYVANIPPGEEQPIRSVDSIVVKRDAATGSTISIKVSGTVWSAGWTNARLLDVSEATGDAIKSYQFVATSPQSRVPVGRSRPIKVTLQVATFPSTVRSVRIVTATNSISVAVPAEPRV